MMVKCMRCRKLLPESKMHKLMRYHEITPGANFNQIQIEYRYYVAHNIGKDSWVTCVIIVGLRYKTNYCLGSSVKPVLS